MAVMLGFAAADLAAATCALLPFSGQQADMDASVPASITASFGSAVQEQQGQCSWLSPSQVARRLQASGISRAHYASEREFATHAAKILNVDRLVYGTVSRRALGLALNTFLIDAASGRLLRTAFSEQRSLDRSIQDLCRANAARLLEPTAETERPPASAPAPSPVPRPVRTSAFQPAYRPRPTNNGRSRDPVEGIMEVRDWVRDRLVVGIRRHDPSLDRSFHEYYLGTINQLGGVDKETELYLQVFPVPWIGVGLGYDKIGASTYTDSEDNHVDGSVSVKGPVLELMARVRVDEVLSWFNPELPARYPWTRRIRPFLGVGRAYLSGGFSPATWWSNGYPSKEEWIADESPRTSEHSGVRQIHIGDDTGEVLTYGVAIELYKGWGVDLCQRKVKTSVSGIHTYPYDEFRSRGSFDLSHESTSIAIHYAF